MSNINFIPIKEEIKHDLSRPWRLPRNLLFAAIGTFAGIAIGLMIHTFHRGLPYIAADIFIWTLATYNASQLGSDSLRVLAHSKKTDKIKELFIAKNITLLAIAMPIDVTLIIIACAILGDWSKFGQSILLAVSAVIICLGLGNIASVIWVYSPTSYLRMLKDRLLLVEYAIFICIAYFAASVAILLAVIPGEIILKTVKLNTLHGKILAIAIMLSWAILLWIIFLYWADNLSRKYNKLFIARLGGDRINIKNQKVKKILKIS